MTKKMKIVCGTTSSAMKSAFMSLDYQKDLYNGMSTVSRSVASEGAQWMNENYFLLPNWKWIIAILTLVTGFVLLGISRKLILELKKKYGQHSKLPPVINYWLSKDVHLPMSWLISAGIWHLGLQFISLHEKIETALTLVLHLIALVNLMRLAYMAVEGIGLSLEDWVRASGRSLDGQLAPFATKVLKIVVITLGFLLSLQSLGFNVGAVLAGLGIGSLALALAAQDTAANLFGSITIILDRPFQRGDYIKVGDTEGTVEEVGFRSTQIRTPYKSIITVPNSAMAKERIDNLGARPSRRLKHTIAISVGNQPLLVQQFVEVIRQRLDSHPALNKNESSVYVQSLGDSDIKISLIAFVNTTDADIELKTQQELLLEIIHITKEMGIELPSATQTLQLASLPPAK